VRCRYTECAPPPPKGVVVVIRVYVKREEGIIGSAQAESAGGWPALSA
jgi:hypothetical protein